MPNEYEYLTEPQRWSRLPQRPWHINVYENAGVTNYQVQASDGEVVGNFIDDDYERPGAARAIAESLVKWSNEEAQKPPPAPSKPPPSTRGKLRLV